MINFQKYLLQIQGEGNPAVQVITDVIPSILKAQSWYRLGNIKINFLVKQFLDDYYLYWGSVKSAASTYIVLWLISRVPIGISADQVSKIKLKK